MYDQDGWTRDQRVANFSLMPQVRPRIQSVVEVIVTCADSINEFFVYLPEKAAAYGTTLENLKKNINSKEVVIEYRPMKVLPGEKSVQILDYKSL